MREKTRAREEHPEGDDRRRANGHPRRDDEHGPPRRPAHYVAARPPKRPRGRIAKGFARLVGRENVIAGADCGFSSQATYRPEVHPTVIRAKFQALRDGARIATRLLWG